ncbi:MAG TPA: DJ-1/PfpI family protein [Saprospiraceae bacterium]|nr:DJ-1/PfpI family protein [Saprospiraceae bacterium]HPI05776.1 DJ-1/PfpI family protein [Saprospiraceae bacterium]
MPVKFTFLVLPHIHLMDLAGPDQVILEAIGFGADWEIHYCSYSPELVSSAGLPLGQVKHFRQVPLCKGDYLLVPGADVGFMLHENELKAQPDLLAWIREAYAQGVTVCSICTGAYVLALSGILDGKDCTTHWKRTKELQAYFPALQVVENVLFTQEDGIFTSAGVAAGIDMTLHIVEERMGEYFAHRVARELVIYNRRSGNQSQHSLFFDYRNHIHSGIHAVQDWLQEHLDRKNSLSELAEIACMSERNFTRIFKRETGLTVNDYITLLRRETIKKLLQKPDMSRPQIARACGLDSERQLARLIKTL